MIMPTEFMRDLESRYRQATGLTDRSEYKIFYGPIHRADFLVLGINPGGEPANMLPNGVDHKDGIGVGAASASYYENGENDLLDCTWRENNVLKLLIPLVGGERERVRTRVVKTNVAFRRSSKVAKINIERAKSEAVPFLEEIIAVVQPRLFLLTGVRLDDFCGRYCRTWTPIGDSLRAEDVKQTVFAAARMTMLPSDHEVLGIQVAHASQFSWTYERYNVVERIRALENH
jgi:hypothetical protein